MNAPFRTLLLACLGLAACRPPLDDVSPQLAVPKSLPAFSIQRPDPGVAQRAAGLVVEGQTALDQGDLHKAIPLLTQALATDPASPDARLQLARAFAKGGRASVAVQLLQPAKGHLKDCGMCLEVLQDATKLPEFKHLRETTEGRDLLGDVPATPPAYASWARRVATALQKTDLAALVPFVDARAPFELVRSCPTCENIGARAETRRPLVGMALAAKVAVRFDVSHADAHGLPLLAPAEPKCKDRCCTWTLPQPVPPGQVGLRQLCFWPQTPTQGVLSQLTFEYGQTQK
jgi:hypothetical protein